ncbi:MAG: hypothetical protein SF051_06495 [Elusimicrobiota bacterium]|nr:hypothetical protein [Elusimicrobiota bacterium]
MTALASVAVFLAASAAGAARVEYRCDERMDLLGVVQALAGRRSSRAPLPGAFRSLESRFAAFRDHPAVLAYERTARREEGQEPYALVMAALGPPPALAWSADRVLLSRDFVARAGGDAELDAFVEALRDFARRSGVLDWLRARGAECRAARRLALREAAGRDPLAEIESYLGLRLDATVLMPLSLVYAPSRYDSFIFPYPYSGDGRPVKGPFRVFSVLEPRWEAGAPRFGLDRPFGTDAVPELLYLAVEPAYARHRAAFEARARLQESLGSECSSTWQDCAAAAVVRALNERLAERHGERLEPESGPAARLSRRLAAALRDDYEPGRAAGRYRGIDDFWPRLIEAFDAPRR